MKKTRIFLIVTMIAMILTATLAVGFGAGTPGSEDDPIVTKSYVDEVVNKLKDLFDDVDDVNDNQEDAIEELQDDMKGVRDDVSDLQDDVDSLKDDVKALKEKEEEIDDTDSEEGSTPSAVTTTVSTGWQVVRVPGKTLVQGETGTEMILRSGSATAVDNGKNGISDLTGGKDLRMGTNITQNHLLLIPGSDGRGIKTVGECFVMINGGYTLVQQ